MKKIPLLFILLTSFSTVFPQGKTADSLYHPTDHADIEIARAVRQASAQHKNVLIQVGGNWCIWCYRFHDFMTHDKIIDSIVQSAYVVYHLNYSQQNFNASLLARYGYPQRFGFPVFLVLDGAGKLIHTQNSWYLEDGKKSYDRDKVIEFFTDWSPAAFDPKKYTEQ